MGHLCNPVSFITLILSPLLHFPASLGHHPQLLTIVYRSHGLPPTGPVMLYCLNNENEQSTGLNHEA